MVSQRSALFIAVKQENIATLAKNVRAYKICPAQPSTNHVKFLKSYYDYSNYNETI